MKRTRDVTIVIVSLLLLCFLIAITIKVIYISPNPRLLDIDFDQNSGIIQGYAALIGSILTFLSILYVVYTIIQQKELFEKERKIEKENVQSDLYDQITLINTLLNDLIEHVLRSGEEIKIFYEAEFESPLRGNLMMFYVNNNSARIIGIDILNIFKACQLYYRGEKKVKNFTELLKLVDFYTESQKELKIKFDSYLNDKTSILKKIALDINLIMDKVLKNLEYYRLDYPEDFQSHQWFQSLNELARVYDENLIPNKESDLERFDNDVFAPFLLHAYQIRLTVGYEYEIQEIIISIAGIRKTMYNLRMDSNYFADHLKQKYEKYYSEEGEYFKRLPKLKQDLQIDDSLSESNN
ncbi:hypothetical protein [uncultured Flavobacterium sp.]|uniref:hypothetical protein n=1 Tax=uncultured Flavobacterium sp. TaxID=165435 RepID=UPI0025D0CBA1|nr:hypothetical protein [uncultured Flavobacterium sp.]